MPALFERTITKIGGSYKVTIPLEIIRGLDLKEGQLLEIWTNNDHILMRKKKQ